MVTKSLAASRWWHIMPIVFITYSLAYLDRANYSFAAAAGINADLGITKGVSSLHLDAKVHQPTYDETDQRIKHQASLV